MRASTYKGEVWEGLDACSSLGTEGQEEGRLYRRGRHLTDLGLGTAESISGSKAFRTLYHSAVLLFGASQ